MAGLNLAKTVVRVHYSLGGAPYTLAEELRPELGSRRAEDNPRSPLLDGQGRLRGRGLAALLGEGFAPGLRAESCLDGLARGLEDFGENDQSDDSDASESSSSDADAVRSLQVDPRNHESLHGTFAGPVPAHQ